MISIDYLPPCNVWKGSQNEQTSLEMYFPCKEEKKSYKEKKEQTTKKTNQTKKAPQ